jgi:general secretion pathway protein D
VAAAVPAVSEEAPRGAGRQLLQWFRREFGQRLRRQFRGGFGGSSSGAGRRRDPLAASAAASDAARAAVSSTATNIGNIRIVADPANNALIVTAKAQEYKEIEAVIKELDVLPLQVLIDATIAEVVLTDDLRYGIKWYFQQGSNAEGLSSVIGRNTMDNVTEGLKAYAFSYSLVAAGKDVRLLLQAQADKGKVNMLSSPSVMVLSNQEASMRVGDQVAHPDRSVRQLHRRHFHHHHRQSGVLLVQLGSVP